MKIKYLDKDLQPRFKNGVDPVTYMLGQAITGAFGVGSAAVSSAGSAAANDKQIAANKELQEDAQAFNKEMYEDQKKTARENWNLENTEYDRRAQQQQQMQQEMMKYIFEKYSSPAAQAKAMQAAGINPAVALQNGQSPFGNMPSGETSMAAPSSISSPAAPTSPVSSVGSLQNEASGFANVLSEIGNAMTAVSNSSLNASKKNEIDTLLQARLQQVIEETNNMQIKNAVDKIHLGVEKLFAKPRARAELKRTINEALLFKIQGSEKKAAQKLLEIQEKLGKQEYAFKEKANPESLANIVEGVKLLQEQQDTERSKQAANYASATESRANAAFTNYQKSFAQAVESLNIAKLQSECYKAENEALISREQVKQAIFATEQARVAASHAEANFWKDYALDILSGIAGSISDVMSGVAHMKSAQAWKAMSKAQQNRVQLKAQELNSYEEEIVTPTATGKRTTRRKVRTR